MWAQLILDEDLVCWPSVRTMDIRATASSRRCSFERQHLRIHGVSNITVPVVRSRTRATSSTRGTDEYSWFLRPRYAHMLTYAVRRGIFLVGEWGVASGASLACIHRGQGGTIEYTRMILISRSTSCFLELNHCRLSYSLAFILGFNGTLKGTLK